MIDPTLNVAKVCLCHCGLWWCWCVCFCYANDTRTRNRYRKPVPENCTIFRTQFSYHMKLEAKIFLYYCPPVQFKAIKQQTTQTNDIELAIVWPRQSVRYSSFWSREYWFPAPSISTSRHLEERYSIHCRLGSSVERVVMLTQTHSWRSGRVAFLQAAWCSTGQNHAADA